MKIKRALLGGLLVLGIVLLFGGCQSVPSDEEEYSYELEKGIPYTVVDDTELLLDVAWPTSGKGPFPALVFLYGGGWRHGSRTNERVALKMAAKRGYVAIAPDYRLSKLTPDGTYENSFPGAVHDAKCAVRWLRANAESYNIDTNEIGARGYSAGGYLALMLGLTEPSDGLEGECEYSEYSSRVQAMVNKAGPGDTTIRSVNLYAPVEGKGLLKNFLGGTPEQIPEVYDKASPTTYVSADDPPVLSIVGLSDEYIPIQLIAILDAKMAKVGASHTAKFFFGDHFDAHPDEFDLMFEFFDKHLKGTQ